MTCRRRAVSAAFSAAMAVHPAAAEFVYVPPEDIPVFAVAEEARETLSATLARLAPAGLEVRWDRRVDPDRLVGADYADWESLLSGEGLAWSQVGPDLIVRPAGTPAAGVDLPPSADRQTVWRVTSGEMLRDVLGRWGTRAGVETVWLTDRRWRLDENRTFEGRFEEAARALLFALSHLAWSPAAALSASGTTLTVVHRSPPAPPEAEE